MSIDEQQAAASLDFNDYDTSRQKLSFISRTWTFSDEDVIHGVRGNEVVNFRLTEADGALALRAMQRAAVRVIPRSPLTGAAASATTSASAAATSTSTGGSSATSPAGALSEWDLALPPPPGVILTGVNPRNGALAMELLEPYDRSIPEDEHEYKILLELLPTTTLAEATVEGTTIEYDSVIVQAYSFPFRRVRFTSTH